LQFLEILNFLAKSLKRIYEKIVYLQLLEARHNMRKNSFYPRYFCG